MKILHVVPSYIPAWRYGGPIHSVHGLCKALAVRGHEIDVATTNVDGEGDSEVPLEQPVAMDGIRVYYFPSRRMRRLYYAPRMKAFLERHVAGYDLVHTHSVFLWPTAAAARAARLGSRPYVVSPRGMLVRELIERRSTLLKRGWIRLVERRNIEAAAAVHVTSAAEGADLLSLGLAPRRMFEIANGVDLPAASSPRHEQDLPQRYVLFLSRISWKKGLDRLVEALRRAPGVHLVVAGNDDEGHWPAVEEQAKALGVHERVRFIGFVEGERKERVLAGADLFVLPSYSENFGNAVLEAMSYGVPVLVTPEVGLATAVKEYGAGMVVEGNPEALGPAIAALMNDPVRRRELGERGRAAATRYSWASVAGQMEAQYRALVA